MNKITKCLRRHWVSLHRSILKKLSHSPNLTKIISEVSKRRITYSLIVVTTLLLLSMYPSEPSKDVVLKHLDDATVLIETIDSTGTGTLFSRKDEKGDLVHFVWTAGHVVDGHRVGPDERMQVNFKNVKVTKINLVNGVLSEKISYEARVIKFSGIPGGDDLALLELIERNVFKEKDGVVFAGPEIVVPGTLLYHVGCVYGESGYNSVSEGMLSQNGRIIYGHVFDQTSTTVFSGSSGGGVFNVKGEYVGMVTMMRQANVNFIVPMRRMIVWAKENRIEWALNKDIRMPREYIRHNLYKDADLDTEFEQFRYFMTERWKKGLDIQLDTSKQLKKLREELDAMKKQLGITNSVVIPPKTNNNAGSFLLRLFGPPDDSHDDGDDSDEEDEN